MLSSQNSPIHKKDLDKHFRGRVPTEKEALEWSIEKWRRNGLKCNWPDKVSWGTGSCALCRRYTFESCNSYGRCPLADASGRGCVKGSQYLRASDAHGAGDRVEFMKARNNMLRRMRRAL